MSAVSWIAVDWGTTQLRIWGMGPDGDVVMRRQSDQGMNRLSADQFEPTLTSVLDGVDYAGRLPVICCGMVGSRQGWAEAPYAAVPCAPPSIDAARHMQVGDLDVYILPGVKQSAPADVMRGEETQVAGFIDAEPKFDGILCLPGTHTKWIHISAGEIVSFRSFMTGEMFALLSGQSVLRHAVQGDGWDQAAFETALDDSISRPSELAARLFSLRAEALLHDLPASAARARLSGLLIGAELSAARPYWLGQQVVILGAGEAANAYESALTSQGCLVRQTAAEEATRAGLRSAYRKLVGQAT